MAIISFEQLLNIAEETKRPIWQVALEEEASFTEISEDMIRIKTLETLVAMKEAVKNGLKSSEKSVSNWCGDDCEKLQKKYKEKNSLLGSVFEKITTFALATAEENLRMGKIVACPTAGSCGIVPSVILAVAQERKISQTKQVEALLTAGIIGLIISYKVRLAGAVAGCQAECGVASAMAAGAVTEMLGGNPNEVIQATTLALKNILGLTCDPVCGLVEVPCIKRNAFLGVHALTASELALSGIESKIPADEVVDTLKITGQLMSPLLKETSLGGLAKTKTAIELDASLKSNK